jgi:hypothetical protein
MNKRLFQLPSNLTRCVRYAHPAVIELIFATLVLQAPLSSEFQSRLGLLASIGEGCEKNVTLVSIYGKGE